MPRCEAKRDDGTPCPKSARGTTDFCSAHGGGRRCQARLDDGNPCPKSALGTTDFCIAHGGGCRCAGCGLNSVGKKGAKCSTCRPDAPSTKRKLRDIRKKQWQLHDHLTDVGGFMIESEKRVDFCAQGMSDKAFALLDMLIEQARRRVIISVDEGQHKGWYGETTSCETARMTSVVQALALEDNVRPLLWIRFNPDAYRVNGERRWKPVKQRYKEIVSILRDEPDLTGVVYMYFDMDDKGRLKLLDDPHYNGTFHAQYVTRVVA